ncbi:YgaP family membrane protein [Halobacteriaceae archaeon SHR40]|uniref:YgaP family membrane protein n=1 Tax=Halovenus amylolytica TaxID=2500550 RepID=UPI000FE407D4
MAEKNVGGRDRLIRTLLAVSLSIVAVSILKDGKRKTGLLAGIGALAFGFNATTCFCGMNEALGIDTTDE